MNPDSTEEIPISLQTEIPGSELGPAVAKVAVSLLIVIGLMIVTLWLLRRIIQGRNRIGSPNQLIQIVERRALSPKTMLYVVSIEGERHLIAESQLEVRPLTKISRVPLDDLHH